MEEQESVDACESCGSTRFEEIDGRLFCANGHEQAGGQRVAEDEDDYGTQGKTIRKKEKRVKVKVTKIFRGRKAFKLYLQAYQLILWKQCYALVHTKALPAELWTVVRDLWTLRLSKLTSKLEDSLKEPDDGEDVSSPLDGEAETSNDLEKGATSSSQEGDRPTLIQTIALCYMGMLLLRVPIALSSLFRWMQEEDIVFVRAIRHVPQEMRARLPGEYHEALDTNTILQPDQLQSAVLLLAKYYKQSFGMTLPPINHEPLLFEYVKSLFLPIEIYDVVKSLNQKSVNFEFCYDADLRRRKATSFPEAQLIALVVIATKLLYPLDSELIKRYPRSLNEPSAQVFDWTAWKESRKLFQQRNRSPDGLERGSELRVNDEDIFKMSPKQLDAYMDWYQRTWSRTTEDESRNPLRTELLGFFPLKALSAQQPRVSHEEERHNAIDEAIKQVQTTLKVRRPITDEEVNDGCLEVLRPGSRYTRFRSVIQFNGQSAAKIFHEAAAEASCLSVQTLLNAVLQTERKIVIWKSAKQRAEQKGDDMDIDAEMGDLGLSEKNAEPKMAENSSIEGDKRSFEDHDESEIEMI